MSDFWRSDVTRCRSGPHRPSRHDSQLQRPHTIQTRCEGRQPCGEKKIFSCISSKNMHHFCHRINILQLLKSMLMFVMLRRSFSIWLTADGLSSGVWDHWPPTFMTSLRLTPGWMTSQCLRLLSAVRKERCVNVTAYQTGPDRKNRKTSTVQHL